MQNRQTGCRQKTAAAKAGISARSGRRIESQDQAPKASREWRTREDPFDAVWEAELVPLLEQEPNLTGTTLWEYLEDHYPGQYPESQIRTLQRRVKHWKATQGPSKPVMFRQSMPPGQQGLSDFTCPRTPITLNGEPFEHRLFQFRLAYSGWRYVHLVQGGESYSALAEGLQCALSRLGGAPKEHRTDSLSAAYTSGSRQAFTEAYLGLCQHYGMMPSTNNLGNSHENGAIETYHGSLKHRIEQGIHLRGSADFESLDSYRAFINDIVNKLNKRCHTRLAEETKHLSSLPAYPFMAYTEVNVRVTTSSTISVRRVLYTVPSRLIGERLQVHLYHDRLECFLGQTQVIQLPRIYASTHKGRARCINYRHVIHALSTKPQAFRFSQLRDDLLPTSDYRALWERADQTFSAKEACRWMVSVLRFACDYDCENTLALELLAKEQLPDLNALQKRFLPDQQAPDIPSRQHSIQDYDALLQGTWAYSGGRHV